MEIVAGLARWLHFFFGVMWIGLLYYFNFVQVAAMKEANATARPADHEARAAARALVLPLGRRPDVDHGAILLGSSVAVPVVKAFTFQHRSSASASARGSARSC